MKTQKVTVYWTELNEHSANVEVEEGADLSDPQVRENLLDQAMELTGTYLGTASRRVQEVDPA